MEKIELALSCPQCGSLDLVRDGIHRGKQRYRCNDCGYKTINPVHDPEIIRAAVQYKKQTQRFQDQNRIERKAFREYARLENALVAYNDELIAILKEHRDELKKISICHKTDAETPEGIINLSDLHMNELVELSFNRYDFHVASKRLQKLAIRAEQYFLAFKVKDVLIVNTGDILNSDRRLDELLNQATNRSNATILSVHLLKQFVMHMNKSFNLRIATVSGNESRSKDERGWSQILTTDNYDFTVMNFLEYLFSTSKGVRFLHNLDKEMVIRVGGKYNVLLLHGEDIGGDLEKRIIQIIGKYAGRGVVINFVIFGHTHSARVGDIYARGSSLVGANAFSEYGLHLLGRASQNIFLCWPDGGIDGVKVDLQNTDGIEGFDIIDMLAAYNAKSAMKNKPKKTIFEVVV